MMDGWIDKHMAEQQIRIRDNGTIRPIQIPPDKLEKMQKILNSNVSEIVRNNCLRKMLGHRSLCCICRGISTQEVTYKLDGATKIERYCERCVKTVYAR